MEIKQGDLVRPTADEWRNSLGLVYEDPESFQLVVLWQDDFTQEPEILDLQLNF